LVVVPSETFTLWLPLTRAGALKVTVKEPWAVDWVLATGWGMVSRMTLTVESGLKPVPVRITSCPTLPGLVSEVIGLMIALGSAVKLAFSDAAPSETVTIIVPAWLAITVKRAAKFPLASEVIATGLVVTGVVL
jgi:hypothetical protein